MTTTNVGLNKIRDLIVAEFTKGGIGLSNTSTTPQDVGLLGGGTVIDACDATTGWSQGGDASAVTLNTTSGEFVEGTGCLNLPATNSTHVATWSKTIASTDLSDKRLVLWFYISDKTLLTADSDAIAIVLGTSGFTNTNEYHFNRSSCINGWNSLQVTCASASASTGAGATLATIDSVRVKLKITGNLVSNSCRMDYLRYYSPNTYGITDSIDTLTWTTFEQGMKSTHLISTAQSNGLSVYEAGDSNGTNTQLSRMTFAVVDKGNTADMTIEKYYYLKNA
jgi:hypothetical protein